VQIMSSEVLRFAYVNGREPTGKTHFHTVKDARSAILSDLRFTFGGMVAGGKVAYSGNRYLCLSLSRGLKSIQLYIVLYCTEPLA